MKWLVIYVALTLTPPQIQVIAATSDLETCLTMVKAHNKGNDMSKGFYRCFKP